MSFPPLVNTRLQCRRPQFSSWIGKICCRRDRLPTPVFLGFPCDSAGKESVCNEMELGSIPGLGRCPGEGKGYPLQYSGLENSMDCIVHGITKIWIWQSDFHFHFQSCNNDSSTEFIDSWSLNTINVESYKKLNLREHTFCKVVIAQIHLGFSSLQFSCSVMSNSLWPHELWHTRPPYPSPTPRVHSNSCPSSWWCHPAISSSVIPETVNQNYNGISRHTC